MRKCLPHSGWSGWQEKYVMALGVPIPEALCRGGDTYLKMG